MAEAHNDNKGGHVERCLACGGMFIDGDEVLNDASGDYIHAKCCGPERESYCDLETGKPLKPSEPLPVPFSRRREDDPEGRTPSTSTRTTDGLT